MDRSINTFQNRIAALRQQAAAAAAAQAGAAGGASESADLLREALEEAQTLLTALKQAQKETDHYRYRYLELVDLSPDGYFVTDANGIIQELNSAACLQLNVPMPFAMRKPLLNFIALEYRTQVRRQLIDLVHLNQEGHVIDLIRITPRHGVPFPASLKLHGVRDTSAGRLTAVRWVLRDLSERTRAEAERYRLVIDALKQYAIVLTDENGTIENWNQGAEILLGYTEAEAIGMNLARIFVPEDRENGIPGREMHTARTTGRAEDERWHQRKDGTRFFASGVLVPLGDIGMKGFVKILGDITDRKQMEDALLEAQSGLERRVAERTAELADANAALLNEVAERRASETARRDLMRRLVNAQEEERQHLSRELHDQTGQYLTALSLGLHSLLESYPPDSAARPLLTQLDTITDELGREVHRLAVELRPTALDDLGLGPALRGYIEEWASRTDILVDMYAPDLERNRIPGAISTILYRIVQEALNNVLKHAQARRVSILLDERPDEMLLIVEDDGRGFDVNQVFEASPPRPPLGLLGIRERASLAGGTCTIESTPGRGTTLFVLVPTTQQEQQRQNTPLPGEAARSEENG